MKKENNSAKDNAITDIFIIVKDKKMYINEKKYKIEVIKNLYELGYYDDHITIGEELVYGDACK